MTAIPLPRRAPSSGKRRRHHAKTSERQMRMLGVARSKLRDGEIGIDGFAGGGGFSLGFEWATGAPPAVAINHDAHAIWMHTLNHPESKHYPEDIFHILPKKVTLDRPVGLAHFSPDCTDFSPAKGGKPLRQKIRGLAWVILLWAVEVRPRIISLENVPAFEGWGPLDPKTDKRIKGRIGETFKAFVACLSTGLPADHPAWADAREALLGEEGSADFPRVPLRIYKRIVRQCTKGLGYQVDWRTLSAADYGVPTTRRRLYLIARCDGEAPRWPAPTHAPRRGKKGWKSGFRPYRTAGGDCIDFSLPCPSIFLSRKEGRALGVNRPLRPATLRRIAEGIRRYVLENPHPYIVRVAHGEQSPDGTPRWGNGQHDLGEPLPTVTGSNDFAVVAPSFVVGCGGRMAQTNPTSTDAPTLASNNANNAPHSVEDPLGTVTTGNRHFAVAPLLVGAGGPARSGEPAPADAPLGTITQKNCRAVVTPHLLNVTHGGRPEPADEPAATITAAHRGEKAVIAPTLIRTDMQSDGHLRGIGSPEEPLRTITTGGGHAVVAPTLIQISYGERQFRAARRVRRPPADADPDLLRRAARPGAPSARPRQATRHRRGPGHQARRRAHAPQTLRRTAAQARARPAGHRRPHRHGHHQRSPLPDDGNRGTGERGARCGVVQATLELVPTFEDWYARTKNFGGTRAEYEALYGGADPEQVRSNENLAAMIVQQSYGTPQWQDPGDPLNTIVAGVNHNELLSAHLTKFNTGSVGSELDEPTPTVTGGGGSVRPAGAAHGFGIVEVVLTRLKAAGFDVEPCPDGDGRWHTHDGGHCVDRHGLLEYARSLRDEAAETAAISLTKFNGTSADGQPADEPMHTVTSGGERGGGHAGLQACSLVRYQGTGGQWQDCDEPARTIPTKDRFALVAAFLEEYLPGSQFGDAVTVEIEGETYVLADIGMRMLQPRELARAQGFPDDYILPGTKSQQVARIGNSVCPGVAEALVRANLDPVVRKPVPARPMTYGEIAEELAADDYDYYQETIESLLEDPDGFPGGGAA